MHARVIMSTNESARREEEDKGGKHKGLQFRKARTATFTFPEEAGEADSKGIFWRLLERK